MKNIAADESKVSTEKDLTYWYESIHTRLLAPEDRKIIHDYLNNLNPMQDLDKLIDFRVFKTTIARSGLVVILKWEGDSPKGGRSNLGKELVSIFR